MDGKSTEETASVPENEHFIKEASSSIRQKTAIAVVTEKSEENKENDKGALSNSISSNEKVGIQAICMGKVNFNSLSPAQLTFMHFPEQIKAKFLSRQRITAVNVTRNEMGNLHTRLRNARSLRRAF